MKVIIVDDNKTFQESLKYFLENTFSYEVIGSANDGEEFLKMENIYKADIILMDIKMPNLNGFETVKKALWKYHNLKFIAITSYTDRAYLQELIGAGFKSCVFKNNIYDDLEEAINTVRKNQLYFPNDIIINKDID